MVEVEDSYFAPPKDPLLLTLIVQLADSVEAFREHSYDWVTVIS